jgi:hypothetical protein
VFIYTDGTATAVAPGDTVAIKVADDANNLISGAAGWGTTYTSGSGVTFTVD